MKNKFFGKGFCLAVLLGILGIAVLTGCSGKEGEQTPEIKEEEASAAPAVNNKKGTMQKIADKINEDAGAFLKEKAERIRESVKHLTKSGDDSYHYEYASEEMTISIDTEGFLQDNHGKYQLLRIYQGDDRQIYIAMLHRTEDEKIYGEVYHYLG